MRNFPLLKTPGRQRERDNIETSENNKSLDQPSVWNPGGGRGQWKMTTDNSRTEISEISSKKD
jgi:hypothetical protein